MYRYRLLLVFLALGLVGMPALLAAAQDNVPASVEVVDQLSVDGTVRVPAAAADTPFFVVIHADNGSGAPGPVIGQTLLEAGEHQDINVEIDYSQATPTLHAMLHVDDNELGVYEFGEVEGADAPITVDEAVVVQPFAVVILSASDQNVDHQVTIDSVTVPEPAWVVIHAGDAQNFGAVIGQTLVQAGTTGSVTIEIDADSRTAVLWPMLHQDTGALGEYEFGTVEGADTPIVIGQDVVTLPISGVPNIRVGADMLVVNQNGIINDDTATIVIGSALSDGPGFLVIHNEVDGSFGDVIGFVPLTDGLNRNVTVDVDASMMTPNLWPMLHTDDNTVGEYEFGAVEDADGPVSVDGQVVTFAVPAAPFMQFSDQALADGTVTIDRVWYDTSGFVVIHADNGSGAPGPVIGHAAIQPGLNTGVTVELDTTMLTAIVYPMLHIDDNTVGAYEFGEVQGADSPVRVNQRVVVGPMAVTGDATAEMTETPTDTTPQTTETPTASTGACTLTPLANAGVNLRSEPTTTSEVVGTMGAGESRDVLRQTQGADGFTWWQVTGDAWVRGDVVQTQGNCDAVESG